MNLFKALLTVLVLSTTFCFGQHKRFPKNLKQAVLFLNKDASDSLKLVIKNTPEDKLKMLSYPWGGEYRTVFEWTKQENRDKGVAKYLAKKGVAAHAETVILKAFKYQLLGDEVNEAVILLPYQEIARKWAQEDKIRFETDSLRGAYIPKDLEDCIKQINSFWSDSTKLKAKQWSKDQFIGNLHHGFGTWLRNNWQLWAGSRLSKYFNDKGIHHPDDMSGIILDSFYQTLHNQPIQLNEQIAFYKSYWEEAERKELERKRTEFSEYAIGDTVAFLYKNGFSSISQEEKYDDESCLVTGKITDLNEKDFFIKVKLLESCDKKGIVFSDSEGSLLYNKKTKKFEKPRKRKITYMRAGQEKWFSYADWESQ